jgi:hypothetical protein
MKNLPRLQKKCTVRKGKLTCPKEVTQLTKSYGKAKNKSKFVKKNSVKFKRAIRAIDPVLSTEEVLLAKDAFWFHTPRVRTPIGFQRYMDKLDFRNAEDFQRVR